jgi:hypothetical protein
MYPLLHGLERKGYLQAKRQRQPLSASLSNHVIRTQSVADRPAQSAGAVRGNVRRNTWE